MNHSYTTEQHKFIKDNQHGISRKELAIRFNKKFGTKLTDTALRAYCQNRGYRNGRDTRFEKGNVKDNGHRFTKDDERGKPYRFKKGRKSDTELPIGTKRYRNGYETVKIGNPNQWEFAHKLLWQENKGVIPPKHKVIFKDGNKKNITIENLQMVSMAELSVMNRYRLLSGDSELTEVALKISKLIIKSAQLKKKEGK